MRGEGKRGRAGERREQEEVERLKIDARIDRYNLQISNPEIVLLS